MRTGKIQFLAKAIDGTDSFGYKLSPLWDSNLKNAPNRNAVYFAKNASKCVLAKPPPQRSNPIRIPPLNNLAPNLRGGAFLFNGLSKTFFIFHIS
jgi:hypothetical protein